MAATSGRPAVVSGPAPRRAGAGRLARAAILSLATAVLAGCGDEEPPTYSPVALPGSTAFLRAREQDEEMVRANRAAEARFWRRASRRPGAAPGPVEP